MGALLVAMLVIGAFGGTTKASAAEYIINHNNPLKVGEYMEPVEGYEFKTSELTTTKEYDKFILKVAPGVYVADDFVDTINKMMDIIEKNSGCKFYPKNSPLEYYDYTKGQSNKKITIEIVNSASPNTNYPFCYADVYNSEIILYSEEAAVGEMSDSYSEIADTLVEFAMKRTYGVPGGILFRGYQYSTVGRLMDKFQVAFGSKPRYDYCWNQMMNTAYTSLDATQAGFKNTDEYFLKNFFSEGDLPAASYWFVEYVVDEYGQKGLNKLMDAIAKKSIDRTKGKYDMINLSVDEELAVIKATLSKNIVKEFREWYVAQNISYYEAHTDLSDVKSIKIGFTRFYSSRSNVPMIEDPGYFTYRDSIEFDYSEAFAYAQQKMGLKVKGISGIFSGKGEVKFYDQYGTVLYSYSGYGSYSTKTLYVPYAVKVVISSPGINEFRIFTYEDDSPLLDLAFNDVTCTDGKIITYSDTPDKQESKSFKVKTEQEFLEAVEYSRSCPGKITVSSNITVTKAFIVSEGTTISIKKGKTLTVKDVAHVSGKITGKDNCLKTNGGRIWLEDKGVIKIGKTSYTHKIRKGFDDKTLYTRGIILTSGDGKFVISGGYYDELYIKDKNKKLTDLVTIDELREGCKIYFNKKQVNK